jgi:hypothetical protein
MITKYHQKKNLPVPVPSLFPVHMILSFVPGMRNPVKLHSHGNLSRDSLSATMTRAMCKHAASVIRLSSFGLLYTGLTGTNNNMLTNALRIYLSIPGGGWEFFPSSPRPERLWDPTSLLSNGYHGLFPWV